MIFRRSLAALLCAAFVLSGTPSVWAQATIGSYQRRVRQVDNQLSAAQQNYGRAQSQVASASHRVGQLDAELVSGAQRLQSVSADVGATRRDLAVRREAAATALAKQRQSSAVADKALVSVYTGSRVRFLDVLFGANSFYGFLTRAGFLWAVWRQTVQLLRQAQADRKAADVKEAAVQTALKRLQALQAQVAQQVADLKVKSADARQAQQQVIAAETRLRSAIAELVKEKAGLDAAIQHLLAELRSGRINWRQLSSLVDSLARQYGVDPRLIEAVIIQESGGDAKARSSAGALGLMQLMPGTAAALGVQNPLDPVQNIRGGITYLLEMLQKFHGNLALALAAYNAGPGAVRRYGGIPPYAETQRYVQDVLHLYKEGK